jgi:hypothetical protein
MPFTQLLINNDNNNKYFTLPITGKACVRVLSVQYMDGTTARRVLQVQSDNLYFAYSPQRFLTVIAAPPTVSQANVSVDVSRDDYHLTDQTFNGNILINVVQLSSSDASSLPASFICLVSLSFDMINKDFTQ